MKYSWLLILSIFLFSACKEEPVIAFKRQQLLENIAYNIAIPQIQQGISKSQALLEKTNEFVSNPKPKALKAAQKTWKALLLEWKSIEILNIGSIKSSYIHSQIGAWPCNPSFIDDLSTTPNLSTEHIHTTGAANKGIYAIEYLLFHPNIMLDSNKLKLLQLETEVLEQRFTELLTIWTGTNSYVEEFTNDLSINIYSPYVSYINAIVSSVDFIYKERLGKPMGKFNYIDTNKVENPYAEISLEAIEKTLQTCLLLYKGSEGLGADDELTFILRDTTLARDIENKFMDCIEKTAKLSESLKTAISNEYIELESLYEEIRQLKKLLKNDLSSTLSIIIILSDTDGD